MDGRIIIQPTYIISTVLSWYNIFFIALSYPKQNHVCPDSHKSSYATGNTGTCSLKPYPNQAKELSKKRLQIEFPPLEWMGIVRFQMRFFGVPISVITLWQEMTHFQNGGRKGGCDDWFNSVHLLNTYNANVCLGLRLILQL